MAKHKFKPGDKKPEGSGMQKGQKTAKVQQWEQLGEYITGQLTDEVIEYIKSLQPVDRFNAYMDLLEYFKPKLQRSEIRAEVKTEITDSILKAFDEIDNEEVQPEPEIS